jgi:hypothetical protein
MSTTGAASSNVNMLRLEYPRNADEVYNDTSPVNDTVEIREPASWLRQLVHQHHQAQADLHRLRQICGGQFDRDDRRIRAIERNYVSLFEGMRYIYHQAQADEKASHEWIQTELMAAANASQNFTLEVWREIVTRSEETGQQATYQAMQITRINDALTFLQTADLQRNQEQVVFRQNLEEWAGRQQTATEQLVAEQQRIRAEIDSNQAAIQQVAETLPTKRRKNPSYLQAAPVAGPSRRVRPPAIPMDGTRDGSPPRIRQQPAPRSPTPEEDDEEDPPRSRPRTRSENRDTGNDREVQFAQVLARTITATLAAQATPMAGQTPPDLRAPRVARLKLDNPAKFDGKPRTPFRTWWDSVRDYIRFYPETTGIQRIAWLGTLLTDEAKEWHQARRRLVSDEDTWNAYSEAIQDEYLDPREAATAFNQLSALRYKGDIKAYLTAFRALNIHARVNGEALQNKVNLALPLEIIDMRFAQNPHLFTEDEPFLVATYEAGRHWENRNLLMKEKAAIERGSGGQSSNTSSKGSGKGSKDQGTRRTKEDHPQSGQTGGGQTEKSGKIWKGLRDAFKGVPQDEIDNHKKDPHGCWRCGRNTHGTYQCYARTTTKGTTLPEAPGQVSATSTSKRKRDEAPADLPTAAVAAEDDDMREVPSLWAEESDKEDF